MVDNHTGYGILNLINKTHISYEHWVSESAVPPFKIDSFTYTKTTLRPFEKYETGWIKGLNFTYFILFTLALTVLLFVYACFAAFR